MKIFCHKHEGFYEQLEGCSYCTPEPALAEVSTKRRDHRTCWSVYDFPIDRDFKCSGLTWMEMVSVFRDTLVKASVGAFKNLPMGAVDLNCIVGYDIAEELLKHPPSAVNWMASTSSRAPEFLGVWLPDPSFRDVYLYSDLRVMKQFIPADCVIFTSFHVDAEYFQTGQFHVNKLFDPSEVTVTARGY